MTDSDRYLTIKGPSDGVFKDRGSRFIGYAFPVDNESEIKEQLQALRKQHPSARHFCYAFRINPMNEYWRANDDGEPSSSAGKPILGQIRSMQLQNVLVVVVRYFGGSLLGVPGLINAYRTAAFEALTAAEKIGKVITLPLNVSVKYDMSGELMKWIKDMRLDALPPAAGEFFEVTLMVPAGSFKTVVERIKEKTWLHLR